MKVRLPAKCPSCDEILRVQRFRCTACETVVEGDYGLPELARLSAEDQCLVTELLLASGNLKALAKHFGVSYPTVRNRVDGVIQRLEALRAGAADEEGEERE